ncbi:ERAD-associated E3 ubiquitin-protein ligase doa10 [Golovinomyces cichoracearum]|uniref:RING-type E3 ubiquitin transferase n=1 Tax=Golovinomyces cichoracearum TaxID=62708 RepID=A0A420IFR0_9PEZI|nr:ERAD-associated E3 ubiquitin-protein ligase doa10 [Golovinomyces cichoracearum]
MDDKEKRINQNSADEAVGEPDTCRICRGEGGPSESLFHPCKCSGSIKYVHQDCLIEWLSHSQKKHCELCKTAFRITKMYSPNMPQSLPFHVLIKYVSIHTVKALVTLMRSILVSTVWSIVLPYTIRQVWRFLFWFSEGGSQPNDLIDMGRDTSTGFEIFQMFREVEPTKSIDNAISQETPLNMRVINSTNIWTFVDKVVLYLLPTPHVCKIALTIHNSEIPDSVVNNNSTLISMRTTSLLSEVSFFQGLTKNSSFNQLVINIAEGYIITVLVVICFVLVFLIREWVVQQQPGINMNEEFNDEFDVIDRPRDVEQNIRPLTNTERETVPMTDGDPAPKESLKQTTLDMELPIKTENVGIDQPIPSRDTSPLAAGIHKSITDQPRIAVEFFEIWRRAEGDPIEVLRIIEVEEKTEQFGDWVNTMKILIKSYEKNRCSSAASAPENITSVWIDELSSHVSAESRDSIKKIMSQADRQTTEASPKCIASSEISGLSSVSHSLEQDSTEYKDTSEMSEISKKDKGKSRSHDPDLVEPIDIKKSNSERSVSREILNLEPTPHQLSSWIKSSNGSAFRPRSMSDSPQHRGPSPLSTNSWIFPKHATDNEIDKPKSTDNPPAKRTYDVINENPNLEENLDALNGSYLCDTGEAAYEALKVTNTNSMAREVEVQESTDELPGKNNIISRRETNEVSVNNVAADIASQPGFPANLNHQNDSQRPEIQPSLNGQPNMRRAAPQTIFDNVTDYLWGGVGDDRPNEIFEANLEETRHIMVADAPLPPAAGNNAFRHGDNREVDQEPAEALVAAGINLNDPDAVEDAEDFEDFEGIMELLGMRGPIFSLVQNALFSTLLLGLTITIGVWLPYNIGRVSLLLMANPGPALIVPLRIIFNCAAFLQDLVISAVGLVLSFTYQIFVESYNLWLYFFGLEPSEFLQLNQLALVVNDFTIGALQRIKNGAINNIMHITDSELSAACHESLITIRNLLTGSFLNVGNFLWDFLAGNYNMTLKSMMIAMKISFTNRAQILNSLLDMLSRKDFWVINLDEKKLTLPIDLELSIWNGTDRFCAVVTGYLVLCTLGTIYVRKRSQYISGRAGHELEKAIIDLLSQAGSVTKVILIISIEMLLFPLYCGLLLDFSLLPIFENTTVLSRIQFTQDSPLTSIFVHWFIGTCYMFHFALFVSMCRKIMRKDFIRDPDDPTFHPVRDVLERNVTTQLQKILFSALIYGGLILICLGGVVWGIYFSFNDVLPVHWSSNEPVLEFPIDLLFYNFSIPLAVKYFKPSTKLHAMYSWWFRQSARALRLSWFLLDKRKLDEEGHLVRKNWNDFLRRSKGDPHLMITSDDSKIVFENNPQWHAYYRRDGRYVRAPASDQVRIPKGTSIFLEVNELNNRIDQKPDRNNGIHGKDSKLYKQVYIPPWFRLRISIFVLSIWIFAAVTGAGLTIIPLVLGRKAYSRIVPVQVHKNDVYAFSIGISIIGAILYCILNLGKMLICIRSSLVLDADKPRKLSRSVFSLCTRAARITWTYAAFLFILPTLFTFLVELYFIVPLHTYLALGEKHVVPFVQNWTLGLLYVKLTIQLILFYENSRPAQSLRAITRNGYLNPDARLATRSFILPGALLVFIALLYPLALARLMVITTLKSFPEKHILAYRYSYPICLSLCFLALFLWILSGWIHNWKLKIRDEVYLDGERLHNFGERRVQQILTNNVKRNET